MRNGLFYVAKDANAEDKDKILGVAMWMPPRPAGQKEGWPEWFDNWKLYFQQVGMNLWYGRGGLNVKVRVLLCRNSHANDSVFLSITFGETEDVFGTESQVQRKMLTCLSDTISGNPSKQKLSPKYGPMKRDITF